MAEGSLDNFKKDYEASRKKHNLPEFNLLNEYFEIEDISCESDFILRKIRKQIIEKVYFNFLKLEAFINPQNGSVFLFNIIKNFEQSDKELINKLYKQLSEYELEGFGLESIYDESKEIEFIKKVTKEWGQISKDLHALYDSMKKSYKKGISEKSKDYLG